MSKLKVELVRHEDGNPEHEEIVLELWAEFSGSKEQLNALLKDDVNIHQLYEAVEESFEAHRGKGGKDVPRCVTIEEIQKLPWKDGYRFYLVKNEDLAYVLSENDLCDEDDEYVEHFAVEPTYHLGLYAWTDEEEDAVEEGVKPADVLFRDLVGLLRDRHYWKRKNQAGSSWRFSCTYAREERIIDGQCDY